VCDVTVLRVFSTLGAVNVFPWWLLDGCMGITDLGGCEKISEGCVLLSFDHDGFTVMSMGVQNIYRACEIVVML